jgi:hypothetical protein
MGHAKGSCSGEGGVRVRGEAQLLEQRVELRERRDMRMRWPHSRRWKRVPVHGVSQMRAWRLRMMDVFAAAEVVVPSTFTSWIQIEGCINSRSIITHCEFTVWSAESFSKNHDHYV